MPKKARINGIKRNRCYTLEEASDLTSVTGRTIYTWSKQGLRLMDRARPILIRGDDLLDFIKAQRDKAKVKTEFDEFYCLRCRAARRAAGGMADCEIDEHRVIVRALCCVCETVVSKLTPRHAVSRLQDCLELTIKRHDPTL